MTGALAVALLKEGAETDKKDTDGFLALELAPDKSVCLPCVPAFSFGAPKGLFQY